jgi:5'-nucleotidase
MEEYTNSRRGFIKGGLSLAAFMAMQGWANEIETKERIKRLTILHTNDWHSRIDPFPDNDPKYPAQGGAARRASLIEKIRQENENVLLLDAGDVFQGTPYFNYYGGEIEFKLMSQMGYDAGTLGNHDFDNGIDGFLKMKPFANFPFINCNYDVSNTALNGLLKPYEVFKKTGLKVGITGVGIDLNGLVPAKNFKGLIYQNPIEKANESARILKEDLKCDLVICLSHLGLEYDTQKVSDMNLAKESMNIDLIIGGHTHTFLDTPRILRNKLGKEVIINQVGWAGLRLGKIDYVFSSQNNNTDKGFSKIEVFKKSIAI